MSFVNRYQEQSSFVKNAAYHNPSIFFWQDLFGCAINGLAFPMFNQHPGLFVLHR
jgi:hypothetical protein